MCVSVVLIIGGVCVLFLVLFLGVCVVVVLLRWCAFCSYDTSVVCM